MLSISVRHSWLRQHACQLSHDRNLKLIMSLLNRNTCRSLGEQEMLFEQEPQTSVSTAFSQVFPHFHECFYNSIETPRTCFLLLLGNTAMQKRKTACLLLLSKCKFSLLTPSLCPQLMQLVLCFSQVMETLMAIFQTITIQCSRGFL